MTEKKRVRVLQDLHKAIYDAKIAKVRAEEAVYAADYVLRELQKLEEFLEEEDPDETD